METGQSVAVNRDRYKVTGVKWYKVIHGNRPVSRREAGIAQWLERRTRDRKVEGSNPCWNGGRIFFSRVNFLC